MRGPRGSVLDPHFFLPDDPLCASFIPRCSPSLYLDVLLCSHQFYSTDTRFSLVFRHEGPQPETTNKRDINNSDAAAKGAFLTEAYIQQASTLRLRILTASSSMESPERPTVTTPTLPRRPRRPTRDLPARPDTVSAPPIDVSTPITVQLPSSETSNDDSEPHRNENDIEMLGKSSKMDHSPTNATTLTPLRAHYLKKALLSPSSIRNSRMFLHRHFLRQLLCFPS